MAVENRDGQTKKQKASNGRHAGGRIVPAIPHALGVSRRGKVENQQSANDHTSIPTNVKQEPGSMRLVGLDDSTINHNGSIQGTTNGEATLTTGQPPVEDGLEVRTGLETQVDGQQRDEIYSKSNKTMDAKYSMPPQLEGVPVSNSISSGKLSSPVTQRYKLIILLAVRRQSQPEIFPVPLQGRETSSPKIGDLSTSASFFNVQLPDSMTSFPPGPFQQTPPLETGSNHHSRPSNPSIVFGSYHDAEASPPAPTSAQQPIIPHQPPPVKPPPGSQPNLASVTTVASPLNGHIPPESQIIPSQNVAYQPHREYSNYGSLHPGRSQFSPSARYAGRGRPFEYNTAPRHQASIVPNPGPMYNQMPQPFIPRVLEHSNNGQRAIHPDLIRDGMQQHRHKHRQQSLTPSDGQLSMEPRIGHPDDTNIIARYLCSHFGNAEFADYLVQLSHSIYQFPPTSLPAHGLILARSPKLRSLMSMPNATSQNGLKMLSVPVSDRFLNADGALMRALMRLYGETLPDRADIARLAGPFAQLEGGSVAAAQMRFALAFAAAGHFLQIDEIISHALLLVGHMLSWSTITKALAFALDGGLSTAFTQFNASSKDRESSSSSFDGLNAKIDSPTSAPAYGFYSDRLLSHVMMFFVHNIPVNFKFSSTASQLNDPPRLPLEAEPKHSRSASRLSQIKFGEMALSDTDPLESTTSTISSIFITLPFPLLRSVFDSPVLTERLGPPQVAQLLRAVVHERESRRQRAAAHQVSGAQAEEGVWRAVRWVEAVEPSERNAMGIKVTRSMAGSQTPVSMGSEKSPE